MVEQSTAADASSPRRANPLSIPLDLDLSPPAEPQPFFVAKRVRKKRNLSPKQLLLERQKQIRLISDKARETREANLARRKAKQAITTQAVANLEAYKAGLLRVMQSGADSPFTDADKHQALLEYNKLVSPIMQSMTYEEGLHALDRAIDTLYQPDNQQPKPKPEPRILPPLPVITLTEEELHRRKLSQAASEMMKRVSETPAEPKHFEPAKPKKKVVHREVEPILASEECIDEDAAKEMEVIEHAKQELGDKVKVTEDEIQVISNAEKNRVINDLFDF